MGSYLSGAMKTTMEDNLKKSQDFMKENQRLTMERQIQMQNAMRERMMATQIASGKDIFYFLATFYGLSSIGMFAGFLKTKKPAVMVPFLPLTFIVAYQADFIYGNKMDRIRDEAERIMREEAAMLRMAGGVPTFEELDEARKAAKKV